MMPDHSSTHRLALAGTLIAMFHTAHSGLDQWGQRGYDALHKGLSGKHLVYRSDGKPVGEEADRTGQPTVTANRLGWECAIRHAATYTAGQTATAYAVTRAFGYRLPARALLTSYAINFGTHAVIDRRWTLRKLAGWAGKGGYVEHCTVVRAVDAKEASDTGPGTAVFELDKAAHEVIGLFAAVVTTVIATRAARR